MEDIEEYCPECLEWFEVDDNGEIECYCSAKGFPLDTSNPLNFND